jgi:hypothetical protein
MAGTNSTLSGGGKAPAIALTGEPGSEPDNLNTREV